MSATLSATYRTLLVSSSEATRGLLDRLLDCSDIVVDDVVQPDQVIASVARRAPDLIVLDVEAEPATTLARVCGLLKANPTTLLVPLVGLAKSSKQRLLAFEAGVDDFLTQQVRREEFLVRVRS
jgi:DNA-binding response OmpR family regulator